MATVLLPVQQRINLTSQQRAEGISAELYNLQHPKVLHEQGQTTTKLLGTMQHPTTGQWALIGDTELVIRVHPMRDVTALISLFPQLSTEERSMMTYYITTNDVVEFQYLMPSDAEILTETEAIEAGWFTLEV